MEKFKRGKYKIFEFQGKNKFETDIFTTIFEKSNILEVHLRMFLQTII